MLSGVAVWFFFRLKACPSTELLFRGCRSLGEVIVCVKDWDENCVDMPGSLAGVHGCGRGGEGFAYQDRWSDWSADGELHFAKYR